MSGPPRKSSRGFTMIELIVVMIMIGILSVVAIPRMNLIGGFDEIGYRDQVIAALEFSRKSAVAARRYVCVTRADNTLSFTIDNNMPESMGPVPSCPTPHLNLPGSSVNTISPRGSTTLSGLTTLVFDPLGRATVLPGGGSLTVTGESVVMLTVDSGTGYVY